MLWDFDRVIWAYWRAAYRTPNDTQILPYPLPTVLTDSAIWVPFHLSTLLLDCLFLRVVLTLSLRALLFDRILILPMLIRMPQVPRRIDTISNQLLQDFGFCAT
jgi:hypothetical protein